MNGDVLVLTAKVHKGVEAVDQKFDAVSDNPFEFTYQITMQPNTDWFLAEVIELKNIDTNRDLKVQGIYLRLYPNFKPVDLTPMNVPRLWKGNILSVWKEQDGDRYLGVTAQYHQDLTRTYWITPNDGYCHADAWREIDTTLKPQEAIRFDNPLYLLNYLGRGDLDTLKANEKRLLKLERN